MVAQRRFRLGDAMSRPESALVLVVLVGAAAAFVALNDSSGTRSAEPRVSIVHAERAGLRLGTQALSGRVTLVASPAPARWRLIGVTAWRRATGRVLMRWDTTRASDGPHFLELDLGGPLRTQALFVRNHTYLSPSLEANDSAGLDARSTDARSVAAVFTRRSYRPGETAVLEFCHRYPRVRVELLHIGPERVLTVGNETIEGVRVAPPRRVRNRTSVRLHIGRWESGVYAARMSSGGKVGFAPFIVRPQQLGTHRVAVVEATHTWQAYNYRDGDGDGRPDTWYYNAEFRSVDLERPYLDRGVPPHFRRYELTLLRWLTHTGRHADFLAQEDIERLSGERLAKLYRLIVFPGHHEYVTEREYDAVQRYRDLGGNLAFLAANNFFWRVNRHGNHITRIGLWRDLGRPEAALVGVQYFTWNQGRYELTPYVVRGTERAPWFFSRTGLDDGDRFGEFGVEVDRRTSASPRSLRVLATIPRVFHARYPAAMTYYESPSGARVFAAGAFTLVGTQARCSTVTRLLENLWNRLAGEASPAGHARSALGPCPLDDGD